MVTLSKLSFGGQAEGLDAFAAIEGSADLFVSMHEALQLAVQVFVLVLKNGTVVLQGVDLRTQVAVAAGETSVGETKVICLAAAHAQVLIS